MLTSLTLSPPDHDVPGPGLVADDLLIGRVFAGKFSLRQLIGVGASGTVYKADQSALGRTVAVKVLRPELAVDPRFVRRFHDEALAASRLNHPNVVSVIDFGQTEDGLLYLVMEFLRGQTLTQVLRTEQLTAERITDIICQVLSALEEAHEGGVIHADLKADNIMVEHRRGGWDLIKVVDFGIARLTGRKDERHVDEDDSICGTPEYMAPEIIRGEDPTRASDIYAVGVMLYELLVGVTPFHGGSTLEVLRDQVSKEPIAPSQRGPRVPIPESLERATMRALQKAPGDRFASAADLERYLRGGASTVVTAQTSTVLQTCTECGITSPQTFKFCPQCGAEQSAGSQEFELALDDTGHDEIWSDNAQTADIAAVDLLQVFPPINKERAKPSQIASGDQQVALGELFPLPLTGYDRELADVAAFIRGDSRSILQIRADRESGCARLLREACSQAAEESSVIFLSGADPSGLATAFYPIRAIVAAILQLPALCSYEEIGESLGNIGLSGRDLPGIGELFQHEGGGLSKLDVTVRRRELFASTMRVLRAASTHFSAVLAFEDFHLYDQPSQELLKRLAESSRHSPSLRLILTTDNTRELDWPGLRIIDLLPIRDDDLRTLVNHFATRGQPDLVTVEELRTFSKGNVGHIEQLLRYTFEGGDIRTAPESRADLIAARLDFLPSAAKRVLQVAAVFGNAVSRSDLVDTLANSMGRIEMDAALAMVAKRGLLVADAEMLCFSHSMVRDVVYESTPLNVRRSLHLGAGDVLIASVADPAVLGTHAERAGDLGRAAQLLTRAGDNAVRQLDDAGAASIYNRALAATRAVLHAEDDEGAQRNLVEISIKLADALRICGEVGLARGILAEALSSCKGAPILRGQLLRATAQLRATEGDIQQSIALFRECIALAIPRLAIDILTDAYLDLATMLLRDGKPGEAVRELEEGIDLITMGEGPSIVRAPALFWQLPLRLAQLYASTGQTEKAMRVGQDAARLANTAQNVAGCARAYGTLAGILELTGEVEKAQSYRRRAIEGMRKLGDRRGTAELLLASSRPTQTIRRITPASIREARLLAEEVGWVDGVRQALQASGES